MAQIRIETVLQSALRLLSTEGVLIESDEVRDLLAGQDGTEVVDATGRIAIADTLVDQCITSARQWDRRLYDRDGAASIDLTQGSFFDPGSCAVRYLDPERGVRACRARDLADFCRLADALSEIDAQSTALVAHDVPPHMQDMFRLYVVLMTSAKPIVTGTFGRAGFQPMVDLLTAVRGSRQALAAKPLAIFDCAPSAPLRWGDFLVEDIVHCAELGIPVEFVSMPVPGSLAPVYLHDALVQHTAETLSGVVISQVARPGAPLIYGGSPMAWDFRETHCIATPDVMKLNAAYVAVGRHLGLATHGYLGLTDSNFVDYQAGAESLFGMLVAIQAGTNMVSGLGMVGQEAVHSPEKLVLDNEMCRRARHFAAGIREREYDPDLWAALMAGDIMSHPSTLGASGDEILLPRVMMGSADVRLEAPAAAALEVQRILREHRPHLPTAAAELTGIAEQVGAAHGLSHLPDLGFGDEL